LEEVQELFPDEVVEGILSAELGLDLSGRFALLNPDSRFRTAPSSFLQMLLAVVEDGLGSFLVNEIKGKMGSHVTTTNANNGFDSRPWSTPSGSELTT